MKSVRPTMEMYLYMYLVLVGNVKNTLKTWKKRYRWKRKINVIGKRKNNVGKDNVKKTLSAFSNSTKYIYTYIYIYIYILYIYIYIYIQRYMLVYFQHISCIWFLYIYQLHGVLWGLRTDLTSTGRMPPAARPPARPQSYSKVYTE